MSKLRIGLIFGGRSREHEISIMSARSVYNAVDPEKYEVIPYAISKKGLWLDANKSQNILDDESILEVDDNGLGNFLGSLIPFLESKLDVVFPILHGPYGEDGRLQGMLEMLGLPYVGAGVLSSAASMDKAIMKELFAYKNIPQGKFLVYYSFELNENMDVLEKDIEQYIGWPCFIKPANMGSSIGISKVYHPDELVAAVKIAFLHDRKIIIEENISGKEVECSVLGNEQIMASLPGEIRPEHEFYDYDAKYKDESTSLIIPAELEEKSIEIIKELALKAYRAVDARGLSRVDFFIRNSDGKVLVNEINTMPGFTRYSMYPKLWEVSGLKYRDLIDKLINLALDARSWR